MNARTLLFILLCSPVTLSSAAAADFLSLHQGVSGPCTGCHQGSIPVRGGSATALTGEEREVVESVVRDTVKTESSGAARHLKKGLACTACHGENALSGAPVENAACEGCHGTRASIALKTDSPKGNPHQSHQGELACTICHRGHEAAQNYCLECHPAMNLTMPEAKH